MLSLAHSECLGDGRQDELGLAQGGQRNEVDAVGERIPGRGRELEREPRLAGSTGAGERDEARCVEQHPGIDELLLAAEEARQLLGEVRGSLQ